MKYALVTGASRGIGRAIAIQLAKDGYSVIINYRGNLESARQTMAAIRDDGGAAELLPFDVSSRDAVDAALSSWFDAHPGEYVDVLVNNAGIVRDGLFLDMDYEQWREVIDTDLNSFYHVTHRVLKGMLVAHHGRIVNISSLAGQAGFAGQTNYSAAKAGIIGVTRSLAVEVAPKGITVNAVAPGMIATDMTADADMTEIRRSVPMRRMGRPEEVADLVSFLVSDRASYITGQVIGINGGIL